MFISVVICTIRREELIQDLLESLQKQTHRNFEIILVGAPGQAEAALDEAAGIPLDASPRPIRVLPAPPGLAAARNVGLKHYRGDYLIFLDDDVTIPPAFLADALALMTRPDFKDVGGLTGYDLINYPHSITTKWKLRRWLGVIPNLIPGSADHLGRNVPISFLQPFSGLAPMGWLPGFCQIYRREALAGIWCDEEVIGGDDRDISMQVGARWRLILSGDLKLQHHQDGQGRFPSLKQLWRVAYGMGRSLAKGRRSTKDTLIIWRYLAAELLLDVMAWVRHPSVMQLKITATRQRGYREGLRSLKSDHSNLAGMRGLAGRTDALRTDK